MIRLVIVLHTRFMVCISSPTHTSVAWIFWNNIVEKTAFVLAVELASSSPATLMQNGPF